MNKYVSLAVAALILSACSSTPPVQDGNYVFSYNLPSNSINLYPDASWLPPTYQPFYPDLASTIQAYTRQSLDREGMTSTSVSVSIVNNEPRVVLSGNNYAAMVAFGKTHQTFMDGNHAVQGLNGINKCKQTPGCWDPHPNAQYPWAFYLPFGMAMVNQPVVNYMNFPPASSLEQKDYLNNATMKRWSSVLSSVGVSNPVIYETIIDGRPLAAAATGQADYLPDIGTYFNSPGNYYVTPMLGLLTNSSLANFTKPVLVLGAPAGEDWAKIIGVPSVKPGDVGTTQVISSGKSTRWVAGNHPNVTSYQCCPGDPSPSCQGSGGYPPSTNLIPDEKNDLMVACITKALGETPEADPNQVKAACQAAWNSDNMPPANQVTLCVQARVDYSWNGIGNCKTRSDAQAFCSRHNNNACASNAQGVPYTCSQ